MVEVQRSF